MAGPDLSEFESLSNPKKVDCPIASALDQLSDEEAEQLTAACAEPLSVVTNQGITKWLKRREIDIPWQRVRSHRGGTCACE